MVRKGPRGGSAKETVSPVFAHVRTFRSCLLEACAFWKPHPVSLLLVIESGSGSGVT